VRFALAHLILACAVLMTTATASATPLFMGLGVPPDLPNSFAEDISADGRVVVGYSEVIRFGEPQSGLDQRAWRWTFESGLTTLDPLPEATVTRADAASGNGSIIVGTSQKPGVSGQIDLSLSAFRWTSETGTVGLFRGNAYGVSADGSTVVGIGDPTGSSRGQAVMWTLEAGLRGLGFFPGGRETAARDVSSDGSVVVGYGDHGGTGNNEEAFWWTESAGLVGLGVLPGSYRSYGLGVSHDGTVAVGVSIFVEGPGETTEAFRSTGDEGMIGLGDLPGGSFRSQAHAASSDGSVIVGYGSSLTGGGNLGAEAFIWTEDGGMQSLQQVLVQDLGLDLSGWKLVSAAGVSADGRTIVGYGLHGNRQEAWIAIIPEPSTALLLSSGLAVLVLRRRAARGR